MDGVGQHMYTVGYITIMESFRPFNGSMVTGSWMRLNILQFVPIPAV